MPTVELDNGCTFVDQHHQVVDHLDRRWLHGAGADGSRGARRRLDHDIDGLVHISQLTEAIKDKDAKVRGEAGRTLGTIDPPDKKAAIDAVLTALKAEKDIGARGNFEMGLGDLGAMTKDADEKKTCLDALREARKNTMDKNEQRMIQSAIQTITGVAKKKN